MILPLGEKMYSRRMTWPASLLPSHRNAKVLGNALSVNGAEHGGGVLSQGPNCRILPGVYLVQINYSGVSRDGLPLGRFEAGVFAGETPLLVRSGELLENGAHPLTFEMNARKEYGDFEVRVYFSGTGELTLYSIAMECVTSDGGIAEKSGCGDTYFQSLGYVPAPANALWINTFEEYDAFIDGYRRLDFGGLTEAQYLSSHLLNFKEFVRAFGRTPPDADPFSPGYRDWEVAFFTFLSGRGHDEHNEGLSLNLGNAHDPLPPIGWGAGYHIGILRTMANYLEFVRPQSGMRFLEMGCGLGNLCETMGRCGCEVSAIEASPSVADLVKRRLSSQSIPNDIYCGSFFEADRFPGVFDIITFEASFHHCDDPMRLLALLRTKIAKDGKLIFLQEPIARWFDRPWGITRYDGETIFQIRANGWMELGFRVDFLLAMLHRTGWELRAHKRIAENSTVYCAVPADKNSV